MEEQIKNILSRLTKLEAVVFGTQNTAVTKNKKELMKPQSIVLPIVNKVGDCEESGVIQTKILDQKNMEAKILLCFYISYKYFKNEWLTTGDIEEITAELGIKITMGNITNKIKDNLKKYLESGTTRKQGQPTPYRLNRAGIKRFKEIIHASEKL